MKSKKTILFVGHSHLGCIQSAIHEAQSENLAVTSIRKLVGRKVGIKVPPPQALAKLIVEKSRIKDPDVICLCIGGNQHNILGMVENPLPFSIGDKEAGIVPSGDQRRHFIPYQLMKDHISGITSHSLIHQLFEAFVNSARCYLNPPPPISDWEFIKNNPGVFEDKLDLGPSPDALKMQLYQIQSEILRECADDARALFIEPEAELLDDRGFLARPYYNTEPTHGNVAYGKIMLKTVIDKMGGSA